MNATKVEHPLNVRIARISKYLNKPRWGQMYSGIEAYVSAAIIGYLVGSIPIAYWTAKHALQIDIRVSGEGNVGARNVFHAVGHRWGILTFIGDFTKGAVVAIVYRDQSIWLVFVAGLAVFFGHAWPVWLKFIGGKGVSTIGGFAATITPLSTIIGAIIAGPVWLITHRFLPTLVSTIVVALALAPLFDVSWQYLIAIVILFICTGIKRLIDEPRMRRIESSSGWQRAGGIAKPQ